jgi:hypothetical protein
MLLILMGKELLTQATLKWEVGPSWGPSGGRLGLGQRWPTLVSTSEAWWWWWRWGFPC